jgi:hypothetical protein
MIDVELGTGPLGYPQATYELGIDGPRTSIVVEGYEDDTYETVAQSMCRALALLNFRGEVRLFYDGMAGEVEKPDVLATIDRLSGTLQITDEYAMRVVTEEEERAEKERAGFKRVASFMREEGLRRGLNKEEREELTLGEALESQEDE